MISITTSSPYRLRRRVHYQGQSHSFGVGSLWLDYDYEYGRRVEEGDVARRAYFEIGLGQVGSPNLMDSSRLYLVVKRQGCGLRGGFIEGGWYI